MPTAIRFEGVSKQYRLGEVGTGTLSNDLARLWARFRGKPDPFSQVGIANDPRSLISEDFVWALRDVSIDIEQGEILGIIGRNGAGKSTLLKLLSRVTAPTQGCIKARGRIASLLEVGTGFHPELTGRDNIYLNGAILGMTRREIRQQLDDITDFSGCAKYIDTPVKRYSSGMLVRLGFAVAAHLRCEILVVDEVLAVGDAEFQSKCMGKMQDVSSSDGRTVLFVSHNMAAMERLCGRGVIIDHGQVIKQGEITTVVDRYLESFCTQDVSDQLAGTASRSGNGDVRLRKCELLNRRLDRVFAARSGDTVTLRFTVENTTNETIDSVSLGFSIASAHGESLVVSYSDYDQITYCLSPGLNTIDTTFEIPLQSGRYHVGGRTVRHMVELDWPRYPVMILAVEGGEQQLSSPHSGRGSIVIKNRWNASEVVRNV